MNTYLCVYMCISYLCVHMCIYEYRYPILSQKKQGRLLEIFYPAGGQGRLQVWDYHQGVPKHTLEFPFAGFSGIDILISHSGAYVALWAFAKARRETWIFLTEALRVGSQKDCPVANWHEDVIEWMMWTTFFWMAFTEGLNGWMADRVIELTQWACLLFFERPLGLLRWSSVIFGKSTVKESTVMALN